jgi:hypothetical protein
VPPLAAGRVSAVGGASASDSPPPAAAAVAVPAPGAATAAAAAARGVAPLPPRTPSPPPDGGEAAAWDGLASSPECGEAIAHAAAASTALVPVASGAGRQGASDAAGAPSEALAMVEDLCAKVDQEFRLREAAAAAAQAEFRLREVGTLNPKPQKSL